MIYSVLTLFRRVPLSESRFVLPARAAGVHSREIDGQIIVVDGSTQHAYALSGMAADIWRATASGYWVDPRPDEFDAALEQLISTGLLVQASGLTRRSMLKRTGIVAAGAGIATIA